MSSFKFGDIKVEGPAQFGDNAQMIVTWAATRASEIQHPRAEEIAPLLDKIAATVSADAESSPQKNSEKLTLLKEIREHLAGAIGIPVNSVSVKATTTDRLGALGRGEGLGALAVVLLEEA